MDLQNRMSRVHFNSILKVSIYSHLKAEAIRISRTIHTHVTGKIGKLLPDFIGRRGGQCFK